MIARTACWKPGSGAPPPRGVQAASGGARRQRRQPAGRRGLRGEQRLRVRRVCREIGDGNLNVLRAASRTARAVTSPATARPAPASRTFPRYAPLPDGSVTCAREDTGLHLRHLRLPRLLTPPSAPAARNRPAAGASATRTARSGDCVCPDARRRAAPGAPAGRCRQAPRGAGDADCASGPLHHDQPLRPAADGPATATPTRSALGGSAPASACAARSRPGAAAASTRTARRATAAWPRTSAARSPTGPPARATRTVW